MDTSIFFKKENTVLSHPSGLFVMFFTEMWERFSFYGMRALLVLFLTKDWGWTSERALAVYGTYTMSVYLTPVLGGWLADKYMGYRKAVVWGALLMALGHACLGIESVSFFYAGLILICSGNGLFKPNMTSIISQMYDQNPEKKDGAFSLYYMGVNAGAFFGMLLCGYIGEKISWTWGFSLAGIFMFFGLLQFYFSQKIFGDIGLAPKKQLEGEVEDLKNTIEQEEPTSKVVRERLIVFFIIGIFTIFFFWAFEQAGGSMTLFAEQYTNRVLVGNAGMTFKVIDTIITITPLAVITYVLFKLFHKTFKKYTLGNSILGLSFIIIWCLVIWRMTREFSASAAEVPATWFGILNALFIVTLSPLFTKWWDSKYNLPAAIKFGLGLILVGLGFAALAYGAKGVDATHKASMIWLVIAYLLHTMGELSISPVGLSYVSKLVPPKWIGIMFGIYYIFVAIGNKSAGATGGMIEGISRTHGLSDFFLIFTIIPASAGLILWALHPLIKKWMHGVK